MNIDIKWIEFLVLFTFLRVLSTIILVIFQASQRPKLYAYFSISQTIIDFSISYYLVVVLQYSITGRIAGVYISFFIFMLLALYLLYKMDYFKEKFTFKYTKEILSFGIPLIPHAIGGMILAMSDRYFISYFIGNSEVGLYTVAYQVSAVLLLVSMSINQAWSPIFFRLMKDENHEKINKVISILFFLFLLCTVFTYYFSSVIYTHFIDIRFHDSKVYFLYLLLGFTFQSFYFLFTNYLFYYKKTALLSSITFLGALLNLILNYFFIKIYGTIGVAYATAITWFFYFIVVFVMVKILQKNEGNYER
jgi:O-antigen/teichoic acid export membrane protein